MYCLWFTFANGYSFLLTSLFLDDCCSLHTPPASTCDDYYLVERLAKLRVKVLGTLIFIGSDGKLYRPLLQRLSGLTL